MAPEKTASLKTTLDEKRALALTMSEEGASGLEVSRRLCSIMDETIVELFNDNKGGFDGALVALGGYGRGLLNPYSDVDLLFLMRDSVTGASKPPDTLLARLWDLGLKVGHSSRTIAETIIQGREDLVTRTSMMESRLLAGDKGLYDRFAKKYFREVTRNKPLSFIQGKIVEMERRHITHGGAVHLTEPNLKESRGGLRDYHTAIWIIRSRTGLSELDELATKGMVSRSRVAPVEAAHSFLLKVRNSLHWTAKAPMDILSHDMQPTIARSYGYDGSDNEASARLMREYFEAAEVIDRFTGELISFARSYKSRSFSFSPIHVDNDGLFTDGTSLRARSFPPGEYGETPVLLFRIARRLSYEDLDPAPNLLRGLEKVCREAPAGWFEGRPGGALLMSVLRLPKSHRALRVFRDAGILEKLIPEFSNVKNLSQFDLFHRYSVDEHTLTAVRNLENLPESQRISSELRGVFRAQADLEVVKLALLLHDLGKRAVDKHAIEPDTSTVPILKRLGLDHHIKAAGFLVEKHLLMSDTAQRRNFMLPETLRSFCAEAGNSSNLKRLYLLTYADISAVGPDIWNDWKNKLITDLYKAAEEYYVEGEALFRSTAEQMDALTAEVEKIAGYKGAAQAAAEFLARAPKRYMLAATPESIAAHMSLEKKLIDKNVALGFKINPGDQTGEFTMASNDKIGLFSIVAGAFTAKNMNIIEARIQTFKGGMAMDTLVVESANLSIYSEPETLDHFEREMGELIEGTKDVAEWIANRMKYVRREPPATETQVLLLNHLSTKHTVVEIWTSDRLGLLYDLSHAMAKLGLDIDSAKISTEGKVAINVFYVTESSGGQVEGDEREKSIRNAILAAIGE